MYEMVLLLLFLCFKCTIIHVWSYAHYTCVFQFDASCFVINYYRLTLASAIEVNNQYYHQNKRFATDHYKKKSFSIAWKWGHVTSILFICVCFTTHLIAHVVCDLPQNRQIELRRIICKSMRQQLRRCFTYKFMTNLFADVMAAVRTIHIRVCQYLSISQRRMNDADTQHMTKTPHICGPIQLCANSLKTQDIYDCSFLWTNLFCGEVEILFLIAFLLISVAFWCVESEEYTTFRIIMKIAV